MGACACIWHAHVLCVMQRRLFAAVRERARLWRRRRRRAAVLLDVHVWWRAGHVPRRVLRDLVQGRAVVLVFMYACMLVFCFSLWRACACAWCDGMRVQGTAAAAAAVTIARLLLSFAFGFCVLAIRRASARNCHAPSPTRSHSLTQTHSLILSLLSLSQSHTNGVYMCRQ